MKNNIAKVRESLNISQLKLASIVGISRPYLSEIENDKKDPSCTIGTKIAQALNKSFNEIFFADDVHPGEQNTA